jgi:hypothetical protein
MPHPFRASSARAVLSIDLLGILWYNNSIIENLKPKQKEKA